MRLFVTARIIGAPLFAVGLGLFAACTNITIIDARGDASPEDATTEDAGVDEDAFAEDATVEEDGATEEDGSLLEDAGTDADPGDAGIDPACATDAGIDELPNNLQCTGLYSDFASRTVASGIVEFKPAHTLWTDGATKHRYVYLPPNAKIDTSNMDEWKFPVGTKFWKEFSFSGKRIETRMFWKVAPAVWKRTTYEWAIDQSEAVRNDSGQTRTDVSDAAVYDIPDVNRCDLCHDGRTDHVLGFDAILLGLPGAQGITLTDLVAQNRLTAPPAVTVLTPKEDSSGKAAAALGYLHANCGIACHNTNPQADCYARGMNLRMSFAELTNASVMVTDLQSYVTTVGVDADFAGPPYKRIAKGSTSSSAISLFMGRRTGDFMPPVGTNVTDPTGIATVNGWITSMP